MAVLSLIPSTSRSVIPSVDSSILIQYAYIIFETELYIYGEAVANGPNGCLQANYR